MNQRAKDGIKQFLAALSVDTEAPELEKTPSRVTELYSELFSGVGLDTKSAWGETFSTDYKGLVAVTGIPFTLCVSTTCCHSLEPWILCTNLRMGVWQGLVSFKILLIFLAGGRNYKSG